MHNQFRLKLFPIANYEYREFFREQYKFRTNAIRDTNWLIHVKNGENRNKYVNYDHCTDFWRAYTAWLLLWKSVRYRGSCKLRAKIFEIDLKTTRKMVYQGVPRI